MKTRIVLTGSVYTKTNSQILVRLPKSYPISKSAYVSLDKETNMVTISLKPDPLSTKRPVHINSTGYPELVITKKMKYLTPEAIPETSQVLYVLSSYDLCTQTLKFKLPEPKPKPNPQPQNSIGYLKNQINQFLEENLDYQIVIRDNRLVVQHILIEEI